MPIKSEYLVTGPRHHILKTSPSDSTTLTNLKTSDMYLGPENLFYLFICMYVFINM